MSKTKGSFTFNGISSATYGLYTAGSGAYNSPERDVEEVQIPGRNGVLVRDNGRFSNVNAVYTILLKDDFTANAFDVKKWLLQPTGYCRLEDSFNTAYYRKARFSGDVSWTIGELLRYGYCDVTFSCLPEIWLKSGETAITLSAAGSITNPTGFTALPLIKVLGSEDGTITIGNQTISIVDINEYVYIDSELQDCYRAGENCNGDVTLGSEGFPKLDGTTNIAFDGGITSLEIVPRWWTV